MYNTNTNTNTISETDILRTMKGNNPKAKFALMYGTLRTTNNGISKKRNIPIKNNFLDKFDNYPKNNKNNSNKERFLRQ